MKRNEIWVSWGNYSMYGGHFWLPNVQGQSEVIQWKFRFLTKFILQTAGLRVKHEGKFFALEGGGVNFQCMQGNFDSWVFKIILRSFGAYEYKFFYFLYKDIHKDDYIAQMNHIVRQRQHIPNTVSAHHIQMNITQNPTSVMTNISSWHSSYQEKL